MDTRYKVGERVILRKDLVQGKMYGTIEALETMVSQAGKSFVIESVETRNEITYRGRVGKDTIFWYNEEMIAVGPRDMVKIRKDLSTDHFNVIEEMLCEQGRIREVITINPRVSHPEFDTKNCEWHWDLSMIEGGIRLTTTPMRTPLPKFFNLRAQMRM